MLRPWLARSAVKASAAVLLALAGQAAAADGVYTPFASVQSVLEHYRGKLPAGLTPNAASWNAWARRSDVAIRARLDQGDLDSMVNLLLFGVTFTDKPRIALEQMAEASRTGLLRGRLEDFLGALRSPGSNERFVFIRQLLRKRGFDVDTPEASRRTGVFVLQNLERVLKELRVYGERTAATNPSESFTERSRVFRDRGVSTDTSILPSFGLDRTLGEIADQRLLRTGSVARVAVIGPGLDFADWDGGYDTYPQQTLQPFGLYSTLRRLRLSSPQLAISVLDISPRVLGHMRGTRERSRRGYDVTLLRDPANGWLPELVDYWKAFGDSDGGRAPAPQIGIETRISHFTPSAVLATEALDANIVVQRLPAKRFDLVVATNVFVYYDEFEQAVAAANVAAMLQPGGLLLTNNQLPELPTGLRKVGQTRLRYSNRDGAGDTFLWYQRTQ